ncbi:ANTAR domain-containing protein [Pseudarthrobacter phenanthrenivorans]|uniref:ANTAR domain-containing protein n=1 Tax=Pseudarthrobacter phenanthrenivorans TaxID=361575 RepID=A0A3B0FMQ9_PSEPS|nr:GAF and ANTAR domain-containing protein [Pseudarthrobacter phenanthrenivorans]RKO20948.1 ANTAR domain-containing protein [Pseudarthrobacter phenanthrenivorans]
MTTQEHGTEGFDATPRAGGLDTRLQELVLDSRDVAAFLTDLAVIAAARLSIPSHPVHAGVTVIRHKRPQAVASSDAQARALDETQNGFGDGPCLNALHSRTTLLVPDLAIEHRWARYIKAAMAQGVSSILAVPLDLAGEAEAVLNLYSGRSHGFSTEDIATAEAFAEQAAVSLRLVLRITQLGEARNDLSNALQSRTVIDMAIGAIMAENRCSRDAAFSILTKASSTRNIKLREVAASVIASISGEKQVDTYFDA